MNTADSEVLRGPYKGARVSVVVAFQELDQFMIAPASQRINGKDFVTVETTGITMFVPNEMVHDLCDRLMRATIRSDERER